MNQHDISRWAGVTAGACQAWPLPADATCAGVARQVFRDAVSEIGLEPEFLDDGVLMASELAANTLHARAVVWAGGGGDRLASVAPDGEGEPSRSAGPPPRAPGLLAAADARAAWSARVGRQGAPAFGCPELWLYLRGVGARRELVCKVFDCCRGWRHGAPPGPATVPGQAIAGRGLQLVHELSAGRWGYHLTRSRLGGWALRGKAVWFAMPAPPARTRLADVTGPCDRVPAGGVTGPCDRMPAGGVAEQPASVRFSARQAAIELEAMLAERGFAGRLVRADRPAADMSVLSVCPGLSVWCRSGVVSLNTPGGSVQRWGYADLVEAAEQTVRWHEELDPEPHRA